MECIKTQGLCFLPNQKVFKKTLKYPTWAGLRPFLVLTVAFDSFSISCPASLRPELPLVLVELLQDLLIRIFSLGFVLNK